MTDDKKTIIRNIKIVVICAVVFFCLTRPFHHLVALTGYTEVRPTAVMLPVCGLLFGIWGALGCALGNLVSDIFNGYSMFVCITSFFIQLATSYMVHVLWYGQFLGDSKPQKAEYPTMNKVVHVFRFDLYVIISALFVSVMIGCMQEIANGTNIISNTTIIIFLNQLVFGILLGTLLITILTKSKISPVLPKKKYKSKKPMLLISNIMWLISIINIFLCLLYRFYDMDIPLILYIVTLAVVVVALFIKPMKPCENIEGNTNAKFFSINESMIFCFALLGIVLTTGLGVAGYQRLSSLEYTTVELWERLFIWVSIIIIFYFVIALLLFLYIEKKITLPIESIFKVVSRYDSEHYAESSSLIISECQKLSKRTNEVGQMSKAIECMITDIGIYTEDIKIKTAERQHMLAELDIASKIQLSIVPHNFEDFISMGVELYADMFPAKTVGGDFYNFFRIDENRLAIAVGDVSGKGIPAALFMSMTKMLLEMYLMAGKSVSETMTLANKYLCEHNRAEMFVTAFVAVYDTQSGKLIFSNAGHNPPLFCRDGSFSFLKVGHGFLLGSLDFVEYKEETLLLSDNDLLVLYTDGVTEANNQQNQFFGEKRLCDILNRNSSLPPQEMAEIIKTSVDDFADGAEQFDDMTMLLMRVKRANMEKILRLDAKVENLAQVLSFIEDSLPTTVMTPKCRQYIELVCEEVFVNICNYAYDGEIGIAELETVFSDDVLTIVFRDNGVPFNPLNRQSPDITKPLLEREIGGLGIYLTQRLTDKVTYRYENGSNVLTLIKKFDDKI